MTLSATHLKRYKQFAVLLWRYGRSDLVRRMATEHDVDASEFAHAPDDGKPEQLVDDLEKMGPTFIKLGQVLASRPDLLPAVYIDALARLQDRVKPFSYEEVEQIVSEQLGVRISKAFSNFEREPLAAASLGQVHSATLRDGRLVVVKIQRPGVREQVMEDFAVLAEMASFLDRHTEFGAKYRLQDVLTEFRVTLLNELDYKREAANLIRVGENLREFEHIQVPQPIADYSTGTVITMDFVRGRKITALSPLARMDLDGAALADELLRAYLKQVLVDGLFHADPHPGNVFLTDDKRIALLDLGMVGHTAPGMQESLLKLLIAVSSGRGEDAADELLHMSERRDNPDMAGFRRAVTRLVSSQQNQALAEMNVGRSLLQLSACARDAGLIVPAELTLLGKTLIQLDEVGKHLDASFEPNRTVRANVNELMARRIRDDLTQGNLLGALLEAKRFLTGLPGRMNRLMDAVAESKVEVKVKAVDAQLMLDGMQKIANRITAGVILGALIIGAALLMRVETKFRLFGYPGFAMLCFLAAVAGGFWLLLQVMRRDQPPNNPPH